MSAKKSKSSIRRVVDSLAADAPLSEAAARLALLAPDAGPPPSKVKEALLARVRAAAGTARAPAAAAHRAAWKFSALADEEGWIPLPFPGVRMREVTIDGERDTALLYVEMTPGARFPDHQHTATERGLVLSGDFKMGDRVLRAGDFYEAAAGTRHEHLSSPSGCTGLLWVGVAAWQHWREGMAARVAKKVT